MNEETLIFYYYGDGLSGEQRDAVAAALASDPALAGKYRRLSRELDGLKDDMPAAAPRHLLERWHDAIDQAAAREAREAPRTLHADSLPNTKRQRRRRRLHPGSFFWGTAVAASLAIGIAIGVYLSGDGGVAVDPGTTAASDDATAPDSSSAFSRGLLVHFRESRRQLGGLSADADGERRELIMSIVQQNRLFERAAAQNGSQDLARVLRAFEPVLLRLSAEDISPADAAALQAQLAFELNVVLTKLARRVSDESQSIDI